MGIDPVLLTGDHPNAANHIARQLSVSEVYPNCLPEDKLRHIASYEQAGKPVCMIGDGINDAPALKKAQVACHGRDWQRYRSRCSGYCAGQRQYRRAATFVKPVQTDDAHNPHQSDPFHDAEFCSHCFGNYRGIKPGCRRFGAQRRFGGGHSQFRMAVKMEKKKHDGCSFIFLRPSINKKQLSKKCS